MGITNNIPPSRLIQPGVIDNAAARPVSPFEGQCIFQKDTDQLLVWNGTAWVIPNSPAQNPDGLELITTATCSAGGTASGGVTTIGSAVSSVTITNAFSSTYDNYLVSVNSCTPTVNSAIYVRLGSKTTGYQWALNYNSYGSVANALGSASDTHFKYVSGSQGSIKYNSMIPILGPFLSSATRIGPSNYADGGAAGAMNGYDGDSTSYTSFEISLSTGTMTGGTIRVYGYRNS